MKKLLLLAIFAISALGASAQQGEMSALLQAGYQTNYERFGIAGQFRYNLMDNIRIAPDVMFFFPKDKVTGLDINLNAHYIFRFPQDNFSVYPLAGFGMQNLFVGKQKVEINGEPHETDSDTNTAFAFNVGGGITYRVSANGYLNAEAKFQFADDDSAVIMLGYGFRF